MITEEHIRNVYVGAPQYVKEFVDSNELHYAFHAIREEYNMHVDHAGGMALAIDAVILGMEPLERFPDLMKEVMHGVDAAEVARIVADVNEKVFAVFRRMAQERAVTAHEAQVASPTPLAPASAPAPRPSIQEVEKALIATPPVIVQKMPAAPLSSAAPTPEPATPPPPKYHGVDPYRELPE